jgi:hydroxymethylbilane synthase
LSTPSATAELLRIGTRGSRLALWQANTVATLLESGGVRCQIVVIKTTGDRSQKGPVPGDDSKRQFVKELEEALLAHEVDVCVHSAKDLPVLLPDGLAVDACLPREDSRDAIVLPAGAPRMEWAAAVRKLNGSRPGAVIGTGSVRRIAQLRPLLPDATFAPIRGNVDTRLSKLDAAGFDALTLACAGLRRLGFDGRITSPIPLEQCVPAPGQGIVATEIRAGDERARRILAQVHDDAAGSSLEAERALVAMLGGGCQLPVGAIAVHVDGELEMQAVVAALDGSRSVRHSLRGPSTRPGELGRRLADELAAAGARELLQT